MDGSLLGSAALISMFLVPVVSLIKRESWSLQAKQLLGLAAALVAAFIGGLLDGTLSVDNWESVVASFATARLVSETLYTQYFGGTQLNARLESVGNGQAD